MGFKARPEDDKMKKAEFIKLIESRYVEITREEWLITGPCKCLLEAFEDSVNENATNIGYFKEIEDLS